MSMTIYKPGQGYYTRLMSAIGLALLVLMGVAWVWKLLASVRILHQEPIIGQAAVSVLIMLIFGWLGYTLIGTKPRVVDFMIAVESEMKKVNWSNRREIIGSTWVVIGLTAFLAVLCFGFDTFYQIIFKAMHVLAS